MVSFVGTKEGFPASVLLPADWLQVPLAARAEPALAEGGWLRVERKAAVDLSLAIIPSEHKMLGFGGTFLNAVRHVPLASFGGRSRPGHCKISA